MHTSLRTTDLRGGNNGNHSLPSRQRDNKQPMTKCNSVFFVAKETKAKEQTFSDRVETKNKTWEVCQDSKERRGQS